MEGTVGRPSGQEPLASHDCRGATCRRPGGLTEAGLDLDDRVFFTMLERRRAFVGSLLAQSAQQVVR